MIFPPSNLSTSAQPWGRVVEKGIVNLNTLVSTERVNNAARDAQAVVNIKRLDDSVVGLAAQQAVLADQQIATQANVDAIQVITDNVFVAGTTEIDGFNIKAGTINASSINAGTLTGFTIQTAASGTRVVMGGTQVDFYQGSAFAGRIIGSTWDGGSSLDLGGSGSGRVAVTDDGVGIFGTSSTELTVGGSFGNIQIFSLSGGIGSKGNWSHGNGTFAASGNVTVGGLLYNFGITSVSSTANVRLGSDFRFYTISSSRRYKTDIQDVDYGLKALQLRPRTWVDKTAYEENGNSTEGLTRVPGFIAEELDEIGLGELVEYKDGIPESISYDRMVGAIIPVIKYQDSVIKSLTSRIEALENN
jgi:hypothetical protein